MASKSPKTVGRVQSVVRRLSVKYRGQFAAIDPRTGKYFIGNDHLEVLLRARAEMPRTVFELKRLGSPFVFSVKFSLR